MRPRRRSPGLLIALRTKGETVDELAGLARTMRSFAAPVHDAAATTSSTPPAPAAGRRPSTSRRPRRSSPPPRAARSPSTATARRRAAPGSADVLEALGVRIDLEPGAVGRCIDDLGFGFMFAPNHHQATRFVVPVRKELAVRTIFNFLGPLTNPAGARRQLIGVSDPGYVETMAGALALLGVERALVVTSEEDSLDEMSITAPTTVVEVDGPDLRTYTVRPEDVGPPRPSTRSRRARGRLAGRRTPPRRARSSAASAARGATSRCSTPARRSTPPAARTTSPRASRRRRPRSTTARRRARSTRSSRARRSWRRRRVNVLERIIAGTREDVARRREEIPLATLEQALERRGDDRPFSEALTLPGVSVIAEHKRRSPSAGTIREGATVADVVGAYERGGAAALSILTESRNFGGSLDDLREARAASSLPILRKDFIVDAYQLYESAAAGADAILLIVAALEPDELADLFAEAARAGPRRARRGARRGRARMRAGGHRRRRHRDQQPRPRRLQRRRRAHVRAAARHPRGQDRRSRSPAFTRARSSTTSSASASTACSWGSRSCAPTTPRRRCAR